MKKQALFNGVPFWSGSVNLLDGKIEEVHSYQEAQAADFHHSLYFSQAQIEKMAGNAWRQPYSPAFRTDYLSGKNKSEREERYGSKHL